MSCVNLGESNQSSNEYLLSYIGFDTTENEPCKICPPTYVPPAPRREQQRGGVTARVQFHPREAALRGGRDPPRDLALPGLPTINALFVIVSYVFRYFENNEFNTCSKYKYTSSVLVRLSSFISDSCSLVSEENCRNSNALPVAFLNSERKSSEGIDRLGKSD